MSVQIKNDIGKVLTTLTVINRADQIRAEDGTILPEQIRSLKKPEMQGAIAASFELLK
jgi:hypothetical protein